MTTMVEFILALITTLGSRPIRFVVNCQKLKLPSTQHDKMQKSIDLSLNLQFKAFRKHFLYQLIKLYDVYKIIFEAILVF